MQYPYYEKEIENVLLRQLFQCGHELDRRMEDNSSQRRVLALIDHGENFNQKELAEMMGVRQPSMSELLSKLESKGYIVRQKEKGARSVNIQISEKGKQELDQMQELHDSIVSKLFSGLSEEEQRELCGILGKLLQSWNVKQPE